MSTACATAEVSPELAVSWRFVHRFARGYTVVYHKSKTDRQSDPFLPSRVPPMGNDFRPPRCPSSKRTKRHACRRVPPILHLLLPFRKSGTVNRFPDLTARLLRKCAKRGGIISHPLDDPRLLVGRAKPPELPAEKSAGLAPP